MSNEMSNEMSYITTINKPLGELDNETAAALFNAWRKGAEIESKHPEMGSWSGGGEPAWHPNIVYRVKPEPLRDEVERLRATLPQMMRCIESLNELLEAHESGWTNVLSGYLGNRARAAISALKAAQK